MRHLFIRGKTMAPTTFRDQRIVYYGPHTCDNCGQNIVKMGREFGGNAFNQPDGPIYPNTTWRPHVCDPKRVRERIGGEAEIAVKMNWPNANVFKVGELGYVVLAEPLAPIGSPAALHTLVISPNLTYIDTPEAAWEAAMRRQREMLPTWHIRIDENTDGRAFGNHLDSLPECPAT
jgi:hypothetical protein